MRCDAGVVSWFKLMGPIGIVRQVCMNDKAKWHAKIKSKVS